MKLAVWKLLAIALAVALSGCSKSSSIDNGGSGATGTPSNNWDSMVWDQGKWQ